MRARTEELLYILLWSVDQLTRPTFRNLTDSFEGWAYRNGYLRHLQALEARKLLERQPGSGAEAIYRLSEQGRLVALGGVDPIVEWGRYWDGKWRLVVFDVPQTKAAARAKLRRYLSSNRFGYLQNSAWITPDPLHKITRKLSKIAADVQSIITLEARPAAGESDAEIVAGAWDFGRINELYGRCLEVLGKLPSAHDPESSGRDQLLRWGQLEKRLWQKAISADPFLPARLLPRGYLGKKVWHERVKVLAQAARLGQYR